MKEGDVEWRIWFSLVHTFIAAVWRSSGIHTRTHTVSCTVSSLVIEALGEDGMSVFPGPGNELSRRTSPN